MPNLLDLSDETFSLIGSFAHVDDNAPLSSFSPHWANFAPEKISVKVYLSFRGTCRRLRHICKLRGLNRTFADWKELVKWTTTLVPENILKAVSRVTIDIGYRPEPAIAPLFTMLIMFLAGLPSLKELIIRGTPLCVHSAWNQELSHMRTPHFDCLSNLEALSIESDCRFCSGTLAELLIPTASRLRHLKAFSRHSYPSNSLDRALKAWCTRNNKKTSSLETLIIKLPTSIAFEQLRQILISHCVDVKDLKFSFYEGSIHPTLTTRFRIRTEPIQPVTENPSTSRASPFLRRLKTWDGSLERFASELGKLRRLTTLDLCLLLDVDKGTRELDHLSATQEMTAREHGKALAERNKRSKFDFRTYESRFREDLASVANILLQQIPSLESGYIWEATGIVDNVQWNRWAFYRTKDPIPDSRAQIDPVAEVISARFAVNLDGYVERLIGDEVECWN